MGVALLAAASIDGLDKHAVNYRGGVILAAIVDWLKQS